MSHISSQWTCNITKWRLNWLFCRFKAKKHRLFFDVILDQDYTNKIIFFVLCNNASFGEFNWSSCDYVLMESTWLTGSGFSASFLWQSTRNPCEKGTNSHLHRKAKQLTQRNGNGESASVKNGGKIVVIVTVCISRKRDAKSLVSMAGCSSGIFRPFSENVFRRAMLSSMIIIF